MIVPLQYIHCLREQRRSLNFNTETGAITNAYQENVIYPASNSCREDFDVIYADDDWQVHAQMPYPYAYAVPLTAGCDVDISDVAIVYNAETGLARATIAATGSGTLEYSASRPGAALAFQSSNVFEGLTPGNYTFTARSVENNACKDTFVKAIAESILSATVSAVNETAAENDDGKIIVTVTGGSGDFRIDWLWDATFVNVSGTPPQTAQRTDLPAGDYMVQVFDLITGASLTRLVSITQPTVALPASNHFFVPRIQSLRFVIEEIIDNIHVFETPDNTLYCKTTMQHVGGVPYHQKVAKADVIPVQFQSNYEDAEVIVRDYETESIVEIFPATRTVQNIGQESLYPIILRNNGDGKTRVYFQSGALPLPLQVNEAFAIVNSLDGFGGSFTITAIGDDPERSAQYLVINRLYDVETPTSSATGKFYTNVVNFDIWEAKLKLGAIAEGIYYATIRAFTGDNEARATSEPIDLKNSHPGTLLFEFYHKTNAFDMNYQTSIVNKIRVEGRMKDYIPAGERHSIRNTDGTQHKTKGEPRDRYRVDLFQLPYYLHRKFNALLDHSSIFLNKMEITCEEGYPEPRHIVRYLLSSGSFVVELKHIFNVYSGTSLGIDGESGFLKLSEGSLLKIE